MNKYAAFPSLHFAWSFIIAAGLYRTLPSPWARWASLMLPVLSLWSILATANHFILDALGGAIVAAFCFATVAAIDRFLQPRTRGQSDTQTRRRARPGGEMASGGGR
jgi:membrane-associated phospholipid phosphatase